MSDVDENEPFSREQAVEQYLNDLSVRLGPMPDRERGALLGAVQRYLSTQTDHDPELALGTSQDVVARALAGMDVLPPEERPLDFSLRRLFSASSPTEVWAELQRGGPVIVLAVLAAVLAFVPPISRLGAPIAAAAGVLLIVSHNNPDHRLIGRAVLLAAAVAATVAVLAGWY